jgi:phospholipid/cholesterol/gamma-HCH transport system substrate-binding protein
VTKRQGTASIVASPVLVGSVTVLIAIIAVFIAYNANAGLPFVPTYDVKAQLPTGAKLVEGNEVRVGGFRVGVVSEIAGATARVDGEPTAIAEVELKLDKTIEPLAVDTRARVRPRSALGLKYVELTPGRSARKIRPGDAIRLANASEPLELEDVFSTFRPRTRRDSQLATEGFGDAFAGRGASLNAAIRALNPLFARLTPVMRNLSDRDTELDQLFRQLGRTTAQAAPVARVQAQLFTDMADTFAAIARDPRALQLTIEKSPPTLDVAISSFRVQRPFLADFADLSGRLRPAARELPRSLPAINSALRVGTPVLPRTVTLSSGFRRVFLELEDLFENPSTLLTVRDLATAIDVGRPAIEFVAPYQTVCNYAVYWFHHLGDHQAQIATDGSGTVQQQGLKFPSPQQANSSSTIESSRPADLPPDQDPLGTTDALGNELHRLYDPNGQPAIDAQGNADCQQGQTGYMRGPLAPGFRYRPGTLSDGTPTGGNWPVTQPDFPGLAGGTYVTRKLGIKNLKDVP